MSKQRAGSPNSFYMLLEAADHTETKESPIQENRPEWNLKPGLDTTCRGIKRGFEEVIMPPRESKNYDDGCTGLSQLSGAHFDVQFTLPLPSSGSHSERAIEQHPTIWTQLFYSLEWLKELHNKGYMFTFVGNDLEEEDPKRWARVMLLVTRESGCTDDREVKIDTVLDTISRYLWNDILTLRHNGSRTILDKSSYIWVEIYQGTMRNGDLEVDAGCNILDFIAPELLFDAKDDAKDKSTISLGIVPIYSSALEPSIQNRPVEMEFNIVEGDEKNIELQRYTFKGKPGRFCGGNAGEFVRQ
ncbi:hypothetical protein K469DRAFT_692128 [Zopfia rhizophila CBS 207.26]|uniref:Uncharacterized protein n=1 Tax=Zopfia rhizophila CBS 207.26 TaxID=1314779 RepID=A0A6A6DP43_9PEZI|nr:hypothetical protein K469DRAFT_692128 [Zopfia rhizophila CBS 207.26]